MGPVHACCARFGICVIISIFVISMCGGEAHRGGGGGKIETPRSRRPEEGPVGEGIAMGKPPVGEKERERDCVCWRSMVHMCMCVCCVSVAARGPPHERWGETPAKRSE